MDTFKHVFRPAVWIVMLMFAFTTGVSVVLADHREPPQEYLMFDGIDDYVRVPDSDDFSVSTAAGLTIAAWMKPGALTFPKTEGSNTCEQFVHWLGKGEGSGQNEQQEWTFRIYSLNPDCPTADPAQRNPRQNRISFYVFNLRRPEGRMQNLGVGSFFQDPEEPVNAGDWIHVVGVAYYDATNDRNNRTAIYKNGELKDCDNYRGITGDQLDNIDSKMTCEIGRWDTGEPIVITPENGTAPLRMGTRDFRSSFLGGLTEVRIWNRPLTTKEVLSLYHSDIVPRNGLVAQWLLNEETGTTARDTIGGHHGTISDASRPVPGSQWMQSIAGTAVIHAGAGAITLDASASTGPYTYPRYAVVRSTQEFASGAIRFIGIKETNRLWFAGLNNGDGTYMHVRRDQPDNENLAFAVVSNHKVIDLKFFEPPLPSTTIDEISIRWSDDSVDVVVQVDSQTKYTHHVDLWEPLDPMSIHAGTYTNTHLTIDEVFTSVLSE